MPPSVLAGVVYGLVGAAGVGCDLLLCACVCADIMMGGLSGSPARLFGGACVFGVRTRVCEMRDLGGGLASLWACVPCCVVVCGAICC